jgi:alcohol dehydrogenase, propanol-preferring
VSGLEPGQPVAVYGPWGCGSCERCPRGVETYCENPAAAPVPGGGGLGLDGGMAGFMLVPDARHLVPLPEGLDPAMAAPLTDAGLTPYHAVRRSWAKLPPGATAVVIGVGGLGHLAVQILKATTAARVIAVDPRPGALALARDLGADLAVASGEAAADQIREATGGRGADVVPDFVGADATLALGAAAARTAGDLTIVGIAGGALPVSFFSVPYEVSVQTTYWGSRPELIEVLDLGARGMLRPKVTTFPLEEAIDVYRRLLAGELTGRAVIVPARIERRPCHTPLAGQRRTGRGLWTSPSRRCARHPAAPLPAAAYPASGGRPRTSPSGPSANAHVDAANPQARER